jgi:hypothetical protein
MRAISATLRRLLYDPCLGTPMMTRCQKWKPCWGKMFTSLSGDPGSHSESNPARVCLKAVVLFCGLAILTTFPSIGWAGSARDYLNAPINTWLTFYNVGYSTSVTPEDGMDVTSSIRANVLSQSVVVTRTMDYWGRTGGISLVLPYTYLEASSDAFRSSNQGLSDIAFFGR